MADFPTLYSKTPAQEKALKRNASIRKFLKSNRKTISKSRRARLLKEQNKNRRIISPRDPTTGAKIRDVNRDAGAATTLKYSDAWKKLNTEIGGQTNAKNKLPELYDRRFADLTQVGVNQANAAAAIQSKMQQDSQGIEAQQQGFRDVLAKEAGKSSRVAEAQQAAQDSSAGRQQAASAAQANIGAVGAFAKTTTDSLAQNTRKEQAEKDDLYTKRLSKLNEDQATLARDIGQDFINQKRGILTDIGESQVRQAAVQATAGNNAAKLAETRRSNKANEKIAQQNANANTTRANKSGSKSSKGKTTFQKKYGAKMLTPQQNAKMAGQIKTAYKKLSKLMQDPQTAKSLKNADGSWNWTVLRKLAAKEAGTKAYDLQIDAAVNWYLNKKVLPNIVKQLHGVGFKFGGSGVKY